MKICTNCQKVTNDNMNFCSSCGAPLTTIQTEQSYQPEPIQAYPVYTAPNAPLGMKIAGMAISILGLVFMLYGFFSTLIGLAEEGMAFGMAFAFSLLFLPLCIVGLVLSNNCKNLGDTSAFSTVGKIFGIIGIVLAGISLFIGFVTIGLD